jgi:DNA-binding transcriptional regulator YiaG
MSTASELKRRAGPRVQIRAATSARSSSAGAAVRLVLIPSTTRRLGDLFEVARLLVRSGVAVRTAKRTIDDLSAGRTTYVEAPAVTDSTRLQRSLAEQGVTARRIALQPVDVRALRARLGVSQEVFAGRYGLDVATVRNWEQGRTKPDGPAAALLHLIDRDPDKVVELLAS